jgi:hypothetical protein
MKRKTHTPPFCNKPHRIDDGKPIKHECFVLPTEYLCSERAGDRDRAKEVLDSWKKRKPHKGLGS